MLPNLLVSWAEWRGSVFRFFQFIDGENWGAERDAFESVCQVK